MRIRNWKYKAALQGVFSAVPGGHRANFVLQRLTGGLPITDDVLLVAATTARHHMDVVRRLGNVDPEEATFFEFGAGWDLHVPVLLASMGARRQFIVDIRPLVRPELVFDVGRRVAVLNDNDLVRPRTAETLTQYLERLGIFYRAPRDARDTLLPDRSIDYATSTNTLEHIPGDDILRILEECHRFLKDDAVLSFQVDFQDHWSYFDSTIGPYNYLTFDESAWRRYNPSLHYQNRLRWSDYTAIYEQAGFRVVDEELIGGDAADELAVDQLQLAPQFERTSRKDLTVRGSNIVLKKLSGPC